jgi:H+/Cl- antiporter ClcA
LHPLLVYSAIAGAFGGFFGSPVVGAVGAFEYMYIKELNFYRHLIPGLLAASSGYGVYFALLHTSFLGIFSFPSYASPGLLPVITIGAVTGLVISKALTPLLPKRREPSAGSGESQAT